LVLWILTQALITDVFAQTPVISLTAKHQQKLSAIQSGHKRLVKFYKFFRRDSIRQMKALDRKANRCLDSLHKVMRKNSRLRSLGLENHVARLHEIQKEIAEYKTIWEDSSRTDSVRTLAKEKLQSLAVEKASLYPGFQALNDSRLLGGDSIQWAKLTDQVPGLDSLRSLFSSDPGKFLALAEQETLKRAKEIPDVSGVMGEMGNAASLNSMAESYARQLQNLDVDTLSSAAKKKLITEALELAREQEHLMKAQDQVSRLLAKYKSFTNSSDLTHAVKRTSLQGSSFGERMVLGMNYNILSLDPFSIDLSLQAGYRFTTRFRMGAGLSNRYSFRSDSLNGSSYVAPDKFSITAFADFDVWKNYCANSEWEYARMRVASATQDQGEIRSVHNLFVGVGRRFLVHPKMYMLVVCQYNLNSMDANPTYPRRFQVKVGFQSSELAFRKKRVNYDPNR
jgi:hypothetical protein